MLPERMRRAVEICGRIMRERISALEASVSKAGVAPPLTLHALCRGLTRSQAARLFYQVCGALAAGVHAHKWQTFAIFITARTLPRSWSEVYSF